MQSAWANGKVVEKIKYFYLDLIFGIRICIHHLRERRRKDAHLGRAFHGIRKFKNWDNKNKKTGLR